MHKAMHKAMRKVMPTDLHRATHQVTHQDVARTATHTTHTRATMVRPGRCRPQPATTWC